MYTIDPFAIATAGYLDSNGECNPITIATDGYIVEIVEVGEPGSGEFRVRGRKPPKLQSGPGSIVKEQIGDRVKRLTIEEEDEEILMIIRIFLQYESKGLLK